MDIENINNIINIIKIHNKQCLDYYSNSPKNYYGYKIDFINNNNNKFLNKISKLLDFEFIINYVFNKYFYYTIINNYLGFYYNNFSLMFLKIYDIFLVKWINEKTKNYRSISNKFIIDIIIDYQDQLKIKLFNLYKYCKEKYIKIDDIYNGKISILSYNISWEAMVGQNKKNFICRGQVYNNECLKNIQKFFIDFNKENQLDFILLQEASKSEEIFNEINYNFQGIYAIITIEQKFEKMTTIYNKIKFTLDRENYMVYGNLKKGHGRPFLALFFNNWLCIINVHHDHDNYNKIGRVFKAIQENSLECYEKLKKYQIILAGDLNHNLKNQKLSFDNFKNLKGITSSNPLNKNKITCCDSKYGLYGKYQYYNFFNFMNTNDTFDHILISENNYIDDDNYNGALIIDPGYKISDHAPIYAQFFLKR